ncbi:MAG: patatin-like phospholipase family protein [Enhygromyxa sp.]
MSAPTNLDWLAAEPFTLVLSAGFFGFYAHAGVIAALREAGLRPRRIVGTSAGAITGGLWAAGVEIDAIVELLGELRREDFWDPTWRSSGEPRDDPGTRLGLLRGRKLDALLADALAVERIEDCPIALAVVTHELRIQPAASGTRVHERGPLRPAIRASCALPILFGPVRIDGRLHADGGISDRPGFRALSPRERALYHHLPHQSLWPRPSGREADDRRETPQRRVLAFDDLPRVHPGALERGPEALAQARDNTLRWLQISRADRRCW